MGPVATLVLAFIAISLLVKFAREKVEFFLHSNFKYHILDALASYIHYGKDIGIDAALQLDSPTPEVLKRRIEGQKYLSSKLCDTSASSTNGASSSGAGGTKSRGHQLASSLVDCRFVLAKVCMPLLRELEFPNDRRNFITGVFNNKTNGNEKDTSGSGGGGGMLHVCTEDGVSRPYVGNDAVYTFGIDSFYAPIQEEVSRRMALSKDGGAAAGGEQQQQAKLRFCPIAMNGELEKNVELVKRLTGMDKVSILFSLRISSLNGMLFANINAIIRWISVPLLWFIIFSPTSRFAIHSAVRRQSTVH